MKIKRLKLGNINVYFIHQKLHEISHLMKKNDIDTFGLSETKQTENHSDDSLSILSYSFFRKNKT